MWGDWSSVELRCPHVQLARAPCTFTKKLLTGYRFAQDLANVFNFRNIEARDVDHFEPQSAHSHHARMREAVYCLGEVDVRHHQIDGSMPVAMRALRSCINALTWFARLSIGRTAEYD
jgi:hypothetical protein